MDDPVDKFADTLANYVSELKNSIRKSGFGRLRPSTLFIYLQH